MLTRSGTTHLTLAADRWHGRQFGSGVRVALPAALTFDAACLSSPPAREAAWSAVGLF